MQQVDAPPSGGVVPTELAEIANARTRRFDDTSFRIVVGHFPMAVTVVTAFTADGEPRGSTATSFCPLSFAPPLVLVSLSDTSSTQHAIRETGSYTVNMLRAKAAPIAQMFATKMPAKFTRIWWIPPRAVGGPILASDAIAYLECEVVRELPVDHHHVFIGLAVAGAINEDGSGLLHLKRRFLGVP